MAPKKKQAADSTSEKAKVIEDGKVKKAPKPTRLSDAAKLDLKSDAKTQAKLPKSKNVDAYLSFEVCKSCTTYKRRANERFTEIVESLPNKNLELLINEHGPPRRGAFEISVLHEKDNTSDAKLIWSGLKKGPPRRLKFPETKDIIELITKAV